MAALETIAQDPNITDEDLDLIDSVLQVSRTNFDKKNKKKTIYTSIDQQMKLDVLNNALASVIAHRLKTRGV